MDDFRSSFESSIKHVQSLNNVDLLTALDCAIAAGFYIFEGWNGKLEELKVEEKGVGDLVSAVDIKAEEQILCRIKEKFPDDLILSEETMQSTKAVPGKRMWIIDPLDGTSCFVFKMSPDLVSVLIALYDCDAGRVVVGLELFPIEKKVVYAIHGKGAYHNGVRVELEKAAKDVPLSKAWVNMNHYSDITYESKEFAKARQKLRTPGNSAARMVTTLPATSGVACQIILGRMNAVIHDNNEASVKQGPWDTAAPQLLIEEAGGVFLNGKTGKRYDTLAPDLVLIAGSQELATQILDVLNKD